MGKAPKYILTLIIVMGALYSIRFFKSNKPVPLTGQAVDPDLLLSNSRTYVKEHAYGRSIENLDMAINAIRNIEGDLDEESTELLEEAVMDLEVIKLELQGDSLNLDDLNVSYSEALNSLTEIELKVTKALIETDHGDEAMVALKYGMMHLKNTLKYTQGAKKDYEIHVYEELDSLLENKSISHDEMIVKLNHIIRELDSLRQDNLHKN
jgi:hypothetical protein